MVEKIEAYDNILKVSLKPTRKFPNGFFFCDADALDLVQSHSWHLREVGNNVYVSAIYRGSQFYFQQEYPITPPHNFFGLNRKVFSFLNLSSQFAFRIVNIFGN